MARQRRPLPADLCLCAVAATAGAVGTALAREYTENPYVRAGILFPSWVLPVALGAAGVAWVVAVGLHVASGRSFPRITLLAAQFSLGVLTGIVAQIAR